MEIYRKVVRNQGWQSQQHIVVTVRHVTVPDANLRFSRAVEILLSTSEESPERLQANPSGLVGTSSSQTSTEDTVEKGNNNTGRNIRRQK